MPSRFARSRACGMARTLKPTTIALDAAARDTSDSEIAPTPPVRIRTRTCSVASLSNAARIASREPCTSVLITTGSSSASPAAIAVSICSTEPRAEIAASLSRLRRLRYSAISRARDSVSTTTNISPDIGVPFRPRISTG